MARETIEAGSRECSRRTVEVQRVASRVRDVVASDSASGTTSHLDGRKPLGGHVDVLKPGVFQHESLAPAAACHGAAGATRFVRQVSVIEHHAGDCLPGAISHRDDVFLHARLARPQRQQRLRLILADHGAAASSAARRVELDAVGQHQRQRRVEAARNLGIAAARLRCVVHDALDQRGGRGAPDRSSGGSSGELRAAGRSEGWGELARDVVRQNSRVVGGAARAGTRCGGSADQETEGAAGERESSDAHPRPQRPIRSPSDV